MNIRIITLLTVSPLLFVACAIYRSSDRDNFDSNALSGAPVTTKSLKPTRATCSWVQPQHLADISADLTPGLSSADHSVETLAPEGLLVRIAALAPISAALNIAISAPENNVALCDFEYHALKSNDDALATSQALVEEFVHQRR